MTLDIATIKYLMISVNHCCLVCFCTWSLFEYVVTGAKNYVDVVRNHDSLTIQTKV